MVSAAVDFTLLVEVNEVDQELVTRAAHEALRVPAHTVACPRRKNGDIAAVNLTTALRKRQNVKKIIDNSIHNV